MTVEIKSLETYDQTQHVRSSYGESGSQNGGEESAQLGRVSSSVILRDGSRVLPVPETVGIFQGVASDHGDKGKHEQHDHQDDLAWNSSRRVSHLDPARGAGCNLPRTIQNSDSANHREDQTCSEK